MKLKICEKEPRDGTEDQTGRLYTDRGFALGPEGRALSPSDAEPAGNKNLPFSIASRTARGSYVLCSYTHA